MCALFNEELHQVATDLTTMTIAVHKAVERAGEALFNNNIEVAQDVIDGDARIDALEASINNQCVILLAKQSPVATDLRVVVSTMSIASLLERMGDLARHIAETARSTYPESPLAPQVMDIFVKMQAFAQRTTQTLVDLMDTHDEVATQKLIMSDDEMDKLLNLCMPLLARMRGTQLLSRRLILFCSAAITSALEITRCLLAAA